MMEPVVVWRLLNHLVPFCSVSCRVSQLLYAAAADDDDYEQVSNESARVKKGSLEAGKTLLERYESTIFTHIG